MTLIRKKITRRLNPENQLMLPYNGQNKMEYLSLLFQLRLAFSLTKLIIYNITLFIYTNNISRKCLIIQITFVKFLKKI